MAEFQVRRWTGFNVPSPAVLVYHLGAEGYLVKHWVGQPGIAYAWRKCRTDRSHWVVSGDLEIIHEKGESYILKAGDRDFIPVNSWYMARVVGEAPVSYLVGEKIEAEKPKRKRGRPKKK